MSGHLQSTYKCVVSIRSTKCVANHPLKSSFLYNTYQVWAPANWITWLISRSLLIHEEYCLGTRIRYRSEPSIQSLGLTPIYLPLPQPTSAPILPGVSEFKKFSTTGQGYDAFNVRFKQRLIRKASAISLYLVSCVAKMTSNCLVDFMYMLFLICFFILVRRRHSYWLWFWHVGCQISQSRTTFFFFCRSKIF